MMEIVTERLVLRPLGARDLDTANAYALDAENTRYMCFLPNRDAAETLEFLREAEAEWAKDEPAYYEFAVLLEGVHIGAVSVYPEADGAELGWIIRRAYWGQGFASEAAKAVVAYFAGKGVTHFVAHCDTRNAASRRVMEKLGMTRTGEYGGRRNRAEDRDSREFRYELFLPEMV